MMKILMMGYRKNMRKDKMNGVVNRQGVVFFE